MSEFIPTLPRIRLLDEFKEFALRGNVVDLAVGVVIGAAFNAVVQSFANDVLLNLVAAVFGKPDFSELVWVVNGAEVGYGALLTAIVNLVLVALGVFLVVRLLNRLRRPADPGVPEPPTTRTCPYCVTVLPREATRCSACTSQLEPLAAG
ncbi:large conductance mechanosensitive channel protein MscL [Euzebya rosea]|uniref:large conductance mechanosensitive channel protein MscL n=1 Tax=Euzebya rosea TaxID=2052804 RepID=UPI00196A73B8|nr:large conductance mechanosensitive channel protein MscL [Euzebya rosea]